MEEMLRSVLDKQGFEQHGYRDRQLWYKKSGNASILITIQDQDIEVKVTNIPDNRCRIEYKKVIPKSDMDYMDNEEDVASFIKHHVRLIMLNIRAHVLGMKMDIEKYDSL